MTNCLYLIHSTISLYEFTDHQLETLEMQMQAHMEMIIGDQLSHLLGAVGLTEFCMALSHNKLSEEHFKALEGCSEKMKALISAPDQYQLPQCKLLTSARLREEAHEKAFSQFLNNYEAVYSAVHSRKGPNTVSSLFPHTPEQTRQLLL